jgi:hypothetical protein
MIVMKIENKLRARVKAGHISKIPTYLRNVTRGPRGTPKQWRAYLKTLTEAFYQRFYFYHPVICPGGKYARQPLVRGSRETYRCPNGSTQVWYRSKTPAAFFKRRYGRGGEYAQGLYAVLKRQKFEVRMVLGYWRGSDALWVEVHNPWTKRWIPLDPAYPHGYGRKFPKPHMKVIAISNSNSKLVNRTNNYKCTGRRCLPPVSYWSRKSWINKRLDMV